MSDRQSIVSDYFFPTGVVGRLRNLPRKSA